MNELALILERPLLTEKMLTLQETANKYAFKVDRRANKIQVKKAVEAKFEVSVTNVQVINVKGKTKRLNTRRGLSTGRRSSWKKAIITLREGDKIDVFEGSGT